MRESVNKQIVDINVRTKGTANNINIEIENKRTVPLRRL